MSFIVVTTPSAPSSSENYVNIYDISRVSPGPMPGCRLFLRSTCDPMEVLEDYAEVKQRIRFALAIDRTIAQVEGGA
jgi:hypothetical protein